MVYKGGCFVGFFILPKNLTIENVTLMNMVAIHKNML